MDRAFNFFDHASLLRQSPNPNNPQTSPPLLPQSSLIPQHQPSNQQTHSQHHPRQHHQSDLHSQAQPHSRHQSHLQHSSLHQTHPQQQPHQQSQHHPSPLPHSQHPLNPQQSPSRHPVHTQSHPQPQHHVQHQMHLQPMDTHPQDPVTAAAAVGVSHHSPSQQLHHRHQSRQQQHHNPSHQFQIHQLQQPHHQPQYQSSHLSHSHQHPQTSPTHQQNHLSAMHLSHTPSPITSLGLPPNNSNAAFPTTAALAHNASQFGHSLSRENQQHQHQHSQFQMHPQNNMSQPSIGQPSNSNNSYAAAQPLHMQPVLVSQPQPSQAPSFGSLGNLPNSVIQPTVVDDHAGSSHHFQTSQSGDALSGPYPWESTHQQNSLGSQNLPGNQNQQQPLLPLPIVGDTRTNSITNAPSNQSFGNHSGNDQANYGPVNNGLGVLGPSVNTNTVVSGLVNGGNIGANMGQTMSGSGTDLSKRTSNTYSITDGATRTGKTVKKAKPGAVRKASSTRGRPARLAQPPGAPITSPVSTATLTNLKEPAPGNSTPINPSARANRPLRGGKMKGRGRGKGMEEEGNRPAALTASTTVASAAAPISRSDIIQGSGGSVVAANVTSQGPFVTGKAPDAAATWPGKKVSTSRSRSRRKNPDGPSVPAVPVHLRNPKKGRARVFRECQQCRSENHIRRSDCVNCKAPLPAGKRRRDGNPSYERKNSAASAIPNAHGLSQQMRNSRGGLKEEIAVSSVISK